MERPELPTNNRIEAGVDNLVPANYFAERMPNVAKMYAHLEPFTHVTGMELN